MIDHANIDIKHNQKQLNVEGSVSSQIEIHINKNQTVKGHVESQALTFLYKKDNINLKGTLQIKDPEFMLGGNRLSSKFINFNNGLFEKQKDKIDLTGLLKAKELFLNIKPNFSLKGNLDESNLKFSISNNELFFTTPLAISNTIFTLDEEIPLSKENLNLKEFNASIDIDGKITDLENKKIDIHASSKSINLRILDSIFRKHLKKYRLTPSGKASVELNYSSFFPSNKKHKLNITALLKNSTLDAEKLPERITNISGLIKYSDASIVWEGFKATFKNKLYTSKGTFTRSLIPILETQVSTDNLNISSKIKIHRNDFSFSSLTGNYFNSSFDIKGDVQLNKESTPDLDLKGHIDLNMEDLPLFLPQLSNHLKILKPLGSLSGDLTYRGGIKDFANSAITASATSESLSIMNYKFNNAQLKFEQGDKPYSRLDAKASSYNGKFVMIALTDLGNINTPFRTSIQIKDAELTKLIKDTRLKEKNISGKLSAGFDIAGLAGNLDSIQGTGTIIIQDGHLLEFNLLKGLFRLLLIQDFENIVFTEAHTSLLIKDRFISTDNLTFISKPIDLNGNGWIDFDKNIDLVITPNIKESEIILSDASFKKGPTAILSQAQDYFNVRISGTLDEPKFKVETLPQRIIEDTTGVIKDILIDGIGSIFDGAF